MDVHARDLNVTEGDVLRAEIFLTGKMFPNSPVTEREKEVLQKAARLQAEHDVTQARDMPSLPSPVKSFQLGHFQMELQVDTRALRGDMCPLAYALLLREGLLYRGVERVRTPVPVQTKAGDRPERPPEGPPSGLGPPPLLPGVKTGKRDSWLPHRKRKPGNPPPAGIAPQGTPPLPGLPRTVRQKEGKDAADRPSDTHLPHPPVSP